MTLIIDRSIICGMARQRNEKAYEASRSKLLDVGLELFRTKGFRSTGLNDILRTSGLPKGSFYHYFENKESFGLAVAGEYHTRQMEFARSILRNTEQSKLDRLRTFFSDALDSFKERDFKDGCLMCNLSMELGANNEVFGELLRGQWQELSNEIAECLGPNERKELNLSALSAKQAADVLLNGWSGALIRMKAEQTFAALDLFLHSMLKKKDTQ